MERQNATKCFVLLGFISRFVTMILTYVMNVKKASLPLVAAASVSTSPATTMVTFTPTQSGTTAAPIVGLSSVWEKIGGFEKFAVKILSNIKY